MEPISSEHIDINPTSNKVHLLVPIVSGEEISRDNTCKATKEIQEFFAGGALRELTTYKEALQVDIAILPEGHPQRRLKEDRLAQIETYMGAVSAM